MRRLHEDSKSESSSLDGQNVREIATAASSVTFSGTDGRSVSRAHRLDVFRPGNAVKAFNDWHISFSGPSSDDAE